MVSSNSFKMRQWLVIILLYLSSSNGIENTADSKVALKDCLEQKCIGIDHATKCSSPSTMGETECTFDISTFSQNDVTALFDKLTYVNTWLLCDNSVLSNLDLGKTSIGMIMGSDKTPKEDYLPTFTIVNNGNLKSIVLPQISFLMPGFFTILNNPRLSRLSIDKINWKLNNDRCEPDPNKSDAPELRSMIIKHTKLQKYGECNYQFATPGKTSLTWPEFRWCRTIPHDVILEGAKIKSGSDPAYILDINGRLTIKNTTITDLSILPVYFKSKGGEISGNKDLCISFEDEIRMKRLDFIMENNKPLSCRTSCDGGNRTLQTIKSRKDCVTLNGGLILDGIDATTADADFFKTIRVINGPVVITNAKVTVDFKELKEIRLAGENSPHISLTNCKHRVFFPNLTTLSGTEGSPMVLLDSSRIDIFNYLNRTYLGKIKDLSRELSPSSTKRKPSTETVTAGSGIVGQPKIAPDEHPDVDKPTDSNPSEKEPVVTNTKVSPAGETDDGAVKNSNLPSQRDPSNSAVEGKSNVLMMMTIVSLVVFLASSATSVGIIIRYSVM